MRVNDYSFQYGTFDEEKGMFTFPKYGTNNDYLTVKQDFPIEEWNTPEAFEQAGVRGYEPMTAKELDTTEKQDDAFNDEENFIEEKFDGTRGIIQFMNEHDVNGEYKGYTRVFSRRISAKTGFYVENSDSVPQLKETDVEELRDTILDGEMFVNGKPFKLVSSTLNCKWDKAIERQIENGFISLHAFDIIKYKGADLRRMSLARRKVYLRMVIEEAENRYIEEVKYFRCGEYLRFPDTGEIVTYKEMLYDRGLLEDSMDIEFSEDTYLALAEARITNKMTPKAYYELIVATGGEGVIIKPVDGRYYHKRGWEYSKIKKFLTRELILMGFDEPTKEYTGKFPDDSWEYWLAYNGARVTDRKRIKDYSAKKLIKDGYTPVTRHYFNKQVGNLLLGVLITRDEYESIPKNKRGNVKLLSDILGGGYGMNENYFIMEVCECGGFDDDTREYFTRNSEVMVGRVVEVRANEIMRDSGRLRHPRYERMREDKSALDCTWTDHVM